LENHVCQARIPESIRKKRLTAFNRLALQRCIQYSVHVKLTGTTGHEASLALKAHTFCVPHDGAEALAEHLSLNQGCLDAFSMTFIGEGSLFRLMKENCDISAHKVDPLLSFEMLHYFKGAGHPQYASVVIPPIAVFAPELQALSDRALKGQQSHVRA